MAKTKTAKTAGEICVHIRREAAGAIMGRVVDCGSASFGVVKIKSVPTDVVAYAKCGAGEPVMRRERPEFLSIFPDTAEVAQQLADVFGVIARELAEIKRAQEPIFYGENEPDWKGQAVSTWTVEGDQWIKFYSGTSRIAIGASYHGSRDTDFDATDAGRAVINAPFPLRARHIPVKCPCGSDCGETVEG